MADLYWEDLVPAPSGYTITFEENGGTTISDIEEATELPTLYQHLQRRVTHS